MHDVYRAKSYPFACLWHGEAAERRFLCSFGKWTLLRAQNFVGLWLFSIPVGHATQISFESAMEEHVPELVGPIHLHTWFRVRTACCCLRGAQIQSLVLELSTLGAHLSVVGSHAFECHLVFPGVRCGGQVRRPLMVYR